MLKYTATFLSLLLYATPGSCKESTPTHFFTLSNGIKVLVQEDHRAPVVLTQLWYSVGSRCELRPNTGLSHVLEHMLFHGTKTHPKGVYESLILDQGGTYNAFTSQDVTSYYSFVPKESFDTILDVEVDRMQHIDFQPEAFQKEMKVVKEERRMRTDDHPLGKLKEQLNALAFMQGPYGNPVIGWMEDLDQMTMQDAKAWYQQWYAPQNMVITVGGDVEPKTVVAKLEKKFGSLPVTKVETPKVVSDQLVGLARQDLQMSLPVKAPKLVYAFRVPSLGVHQDTAYALGLVSAWLEGKNYPLYTQLVREQKVATNVSVEYNFYQKGYSLFVVDVSPAPGVSLAQLATVFEKTWNTLAQTTPTDTALANLKMGWVSGKVYDSDSLSAQLQTIGYLETIGLGWQTYQKGFEKVEAMRLDDLQAAFQKHLSLKQVICINVTPQEAS